MHHQHSSTCTEGQLLPRALSPPLSTALPATPRCAHTLSFIINGLINLELLLPRSAVGELLQFRVSMQVPNHEAAAHAPGESWGCSSLPGSVSPVIIGRSGADSSEEQHHF